MRLTSTDITPSPLAVGWVRLRGQIDFRTPGRAGESIWFDVPAELEGQLSRTGNPWLACLLPYAVTLHEPLELCLPVDAALRENVEAIMQVWDGWYPGAYPPITIDVDVVPPGLTQGGTRTGSFFSGGLDSFHTLLRHQPAGDAVHRLAIDDLITIWGFDIPLTATGSFERLVARVEEIGRATGTTVVPIASNLRESGWSVTNWGRVSQGAALAGVALALEGRFRRVLIPSSIHYRYNEHWGTNPLVDRLYSSGTTLLANDGAGSRRSEKSRVVVESDLAMRHLRVCWMDRSDVNCGRCEKCLRTLTEFELNGRLDRCVSFPTGAWSLQALGDLHLRHDLDEENMLQLLRHAKDFCRDDVAIAVKASIRRYRIRRLLGGLARGIGLRRRRRA